MSQSWRGASCVIYLLEKNAGSTAAHGTSSTRTYARHWTPVHLDFVADYVEAAKEKALTAGAICKSGSTEWAGSRCITFSDPFGHGFCLIEFSAGSYQATE